MQKRYSHVTNFKISLIYSEKMPNNSKMPVNPYLKEVGHPHGQDYGFLQQSLGFCQVSDVVPSDVGVLLYYISL